LCVSRKRSGFAVAVGVGVFVGVVVGVRVAVGVGVAAGVRVAVPVAVGVGDGPPLPAKPTRLDIAAGAATVASKITAVQATSAEVLTIRATPWATAVVVTTAFSRKACVPVVPKVDSRTGRDVQNGSVAGSNAVANRAFGAQ